MAAAHAGRVLRALGAAYRRTHAPDHRRRRAPGAPLSIAAPLRSAGCESAATVAGPSATSITHAAIGIARSARAGQGSVARGAPARVVAGALLPLGVHAAARAQCARRPGIRAGSTIRCSAAPRRRSLEFAANPRWLGATPAFTLVLHTWTQDLRTHLHVHALVACGGLDGEGRWRTPGRGRGFLFPVHAASRVFRGKFLDALDQARRTGRIPDDPQAEPHAWRARRRALLAHDWVVYAKPPPGGPAQVLEYLARYTHRVAISNERILGCDDDQVRFRVRDNRSGGKRIVTLAARRVHRPLPAPCAAPRLQAHPSLRACSPRPQACATGRRAGGAADARAAAVAIEAAEAFLTRVSGHDPRSLPALCARALASGRKMCRP